MKKITLLLCVLLIVGGASAQPPAGQASPGQASPPGHNGGPSGGPSASGHLYGKLLDSEGHGIGQASVLILQTVTDPASGRRKSQLLKGGATQANGDFSAEDLPL